MAAPVQYPAVEFKYDWRGKVMDFFGRVWFDAPVNDLKMELEHWLPKFRSAWDLGYNDSTAIWFFQQCGQEIHLLEYYENSGEALTHYLHYLKSKSYTYGKHLVPHDAAVHEYSTGLSRVEVARNHGIHFTVVPDIGINEGIDAVRNILNRCWFEEIKCIKGITALESYKKQWNDRHGCWSSQPLHNFASHGADAFRMLAVGLGKLENKGLTADEWKRLKNQYSLLY